MCGFLMFMFRTRFGLSTLRFVDGSSHEFGRDVHDGPLTVTCCTLNNTAATWLHVDPSLQIFFKYVHL